MQKYKDIYDAISRQVLYFKKTDGGAEYLCLKPIEGTDCGDIQTAIVRLDGGAELLDNDNTVVA
jgi:hypothetical protein